MALSLSTVQTFIQRPISNHGDNPDKAPIHNTSTPSSASNRSSQLASVSSSESDIWPTDQRPKHKHIREEDQDLARDMMAGKRSVKGRRRKCEGCRMEYGELKIDAVKEEIQ